jgi:hypothetical protein
VILVADGQRRSRLWGTFENHGEVPAERGQPTRATDTAGTSPSASLPTPAQPGKSQRRRQTMPDTSHSAFSASSDPAHAPPR